MIAPAEPSRLGGVGPPPANPVDRSRWGDPARRADAAARTWDAIVIGAGVAGTVAARQLARRGLSVVLVERSELPRGKVCGGCLSAAALADLASAGLGGLPTAIGGVPLTEIELCRGRRRVRLPLPGGVAVSRVALDAALADEADRAGVTILTGGPATLWPDGPQGRAGGAGPVRTVRVGGGGPASVTLAGRVVLVATGLGPSGVPLMREAGPIAGTAEPADPPGERFRRNIRPGSRIGLGCLVSAGSLGGAWADLVAGRVRMVGGPGGYVGLTRVEGGDVDLAAAVDVAAVADGAGPPAAVRRVLASAGLDLPGDIPAAAWRGTAALTRTTAPVAARRVLLLGDATGYVEPFTGEGMGWAIAQALAAADLLGDAARRTVDGDPWSADVPARWEAFVRGAIRPRQATCRRLAWVLRRPWASGLALVLAGLCPPLTRRVVAPLHAVGPPATGA